MKHRYLIPTLIVPLLTAPTFAQTVSPKQSTARPYGLNIVSPVYARGSDARSLDFKNNILPDIQSYVNTNMSEGIARDPNKLVALNPESLRLLTDYDARVYFVGEGAGYHNSLAFRTQEFATWKESDVQLIFPDGSSRVRNYNLNYDGITRTAAEPLLPGDFVDLGTIGHGHRIDFTLYADAVNGGTNKWWVQQNRNADGLNHVVYYARPNSPYLMIGFEDMYNGGDLDYNDLVFAVDIGEANIANLLAAPEPLAAATLAPLLAFGLSQRRRRLNPAIARA